MYDVNPFDISDVEEEILLDDDSADHVHDINCMENALNKNQDRVIGIQCYLTGELIDDPTEHLAESCDPNYEHSQREGRIAYESNR